MDQPKIWVERPGKKMPHAFLPDDTYAQAIAAFVIVCSDILLINKVRKTFYLAKRIAKPMQGLWLIGGRRLAGETAVDGARRRFKNETGLDIEPKRFNFLAVMELLWKDRQQPPQDIGCHNLSYTFTLELTKQELAKAQTALDEAEYEKDFGLKEFSYQDMVTQKVHPAFLYFWQELFGQA